MLRKCTKVAHLEGTRPELTLLVMSTGHRKGAAVQGNSRSQFMLCTYDAILSKGSGGGQGVQRPLLHQIVSEHD